MSTPIDQLVADHLAIWNGAPAVTGRDVITVRNGAIESVYVLIDAPAS